MKTEIIYLCNNCEQPLKQPYCPKCRTKSVYPVTQPGNYVKMGNFYWELKNEDDVITTKKILKELEERKKGKKNDNFLDVSADI